MLKIDSNENKKIKRLISLKQKKVRLKENLFLIEGIKSVKEAVISSVKVNSVYVSELFYRNNQEYILEMEEKRLAVFCIKESLFVKCSSLKTPQGILIAMEIPKYNLVNIIKKEKPIIILDRINDPGNLGTIIRTADAFDFGGVLLLPGCVDIYNFKTIQATMGSVLRMDCIYIECDDMLVLENAGYTIFGMDLGGRELKRNRTFGEKCAVVIGNESHGLSDCSKTHCMELIKINIMKKTESLNAAVAAGIIMNKIAQT